MIFVLLLKGRAVGIQTDIVAFMPLSPVDFED